MESLLLVALAFWAGFKLGKHVAVIKIVKGILSDPTDLQRALKEFQEVRVLEQTEEKPEGMSVERHGNQIYLFASPSNEFLAQGNSLQEALEQVEKRFPDRNFQGKLDKEQADRLGIKID